MRDVQSAERRTIIEFQHDSSCGALRHDLSFQWSQDEVLPKTTVQILLPDSVVVQQTLIVQSTGIDGVMGEYYADIASCDELGSWSVYNSGDQGTEFFSSLSSDSLPKGVVGYTSTIIDERRGKAVTTQRIFLRFIRNGQLGQMWISVTNPSKSPADLRPQDLIDAALKQAGATLDSTALDGA
ncbi:hypothetical protein [Actinomyces slackii]|uniref:hypothetical protein n=1 Tax=Actinomyces slackii TaxID=52774 RepID=UPI0012EBC635|nr:hypothetical protein [Actinomyces slackii]